MTKVEKFQKLVAEINMTNNGKLMICRVPTELQDIVPELLFSGFLKRDSFLETGDSIRLA